jgi:hypothetical protein
VGWLTLFSSSSQAQNNSAEDLSSLAFNESYPSNHEKTYTFRISFYVVGTRGKGEVNTGTNYLGFRCVKEASTKTAGRWD